MRETNARHFNCFGLSLYDGSNSNTFIYFLFLDGQGTLTAAGKVGRTFERDDVRSSKCVIPQT